MIKKTQPNKSFLSSSKERALRKDSVSVMGEVCDHDPSDLPRTSHSSLFSRYCMLLCAETWNQVLVRLKVTLSLLHFLAVQQRKEGPLSPQRNLSRFAATSVSSLVLTAPQPEKHVLNIEGHSTGLQVSWYLFLRNHSAQTVLTKTSNSVKKLEAHLHNLGLYITVSHLTGWGESDVYWELEVSAVCIPCWVRHKGGSGQSRNGGDHSVCSGKGGGEKP